ncbi:unnamed protein product, partial [Ectocarpus sp. 12 AP-2014]
MERLQWWRVAAFSPEGVAGWCSRTSLKFPGSCCKSMSTTNWGCNTALEPSRKPNQPIRALPPPSNNAIRHLLFKQRCTRKWPSRIAFQLAFQLLPVLVHVQPSKPKTWTNR